MRHHVDEEALDLRKIYLKNHLVIKELSENLEKELANMQNIEEASARLEKNINNQMIEIRSIEKANANLKAKIDQKRQLNDPEKNQIKDLDGFIKASKSVFTAKAFFNLENDGKKQEALQGRSGEVLMEIAKISENVSLLKQNIFDLKRAEIELKDTSHAEKHKKLKEINAEIQNYNEKTVKVRYKNPFGGEEICDFPMVDHLGNKLKFEQLLGNACRYWDIYPYGNILMDEDYLVWPGSKFISDEVTDDKEVWVMSKAEANYFKAVKSNEKAERGEEIVDENEETSKNFSDSEVEDELEQKNEVFRKEKEDVEKEIAVTKARHRNVLNLLIYAVFLVGFTWSISQSSQIEVNFHTASGLRNELFTMQFPVNSSSPNTFDTINLFEDFSNFMSGPLVSTLFSTYKYNGDLLSTSEKNYVNYKYKKIGPTRFLQKKVSLQTCSQDFSVNLGRESLICYKDLSSNNEYTKTLKITDFPSTYSSWLEYTDVSSPRSIVGTFNTYKLTGYVAYIKATDSYENALAQIELMTSKWIDLQTRVLSVDSNFCNYNSDMCVSLSILFEFIAGGGVLAKSEIIAYRVNLNWKTQDLLRIGFDCVVGFIMLYFLIEFIIKARAQGAKAAFKNFWNLLLLLMISMIFAKHMAFVVYQNQEEIKNFIDENNEFVDYMIVADLYKMIANFTGISGFIAYFYILAFFQESKSLKVIWGTLGQALYRLLFFFLVFLLVFIGWMLLAYKGFGEYLNNYSNLGNTASTLLQMLLGNVDFDELYQIQPEFAGIFFFLFIFLNYFVMLNVFLAIINESYDTVYKKIKSNDDADEMIIILGILINGFVHSFYKVPKRIIKCKCCRKKQKKSKKAKKRNITSFDSEENNSKS